MAHAIGNQPSLIDRLELGSSRNGTNNGPAMDQPWTRPWYQPLDPGAILKSQPLLRGLDSSSIIHIFSSKPYYKLHTL